MDNKQFIKISVRNIVEFIMRSGNLDNSRSASKEIDAMQQGIRLHKKIQQRMPAGYMSEVSLSHTTDFEREGIDFQICVEGRADGIYVAEEKFNEKEYNTITVIDEIKCVLRDLINISEPVSFHRAQAMCYAFIYAFDNKLSNIGIRIIYCNIETEQTKNFEEDFTFEELEKWFDELLLEYAKWASYQIKWEKVRNNSIKKLQFPFEYRPGQKDLAAGVYRSIVRDKKLYIQAPTGVGKTISTVFPTIKAMGEGEVEKIFYLTAKTITRTAAQNTFSLLKNNDLDFKAITITSKDKICILDKPNCNPIACERAKGHFDRVNDAVFDLINNESEINREIIEEYAHKYMVCPFEMSLDVSLWVDAIICDYNYVFDPNVYLRRFFEGEKESKYVFLIDEAHNLVDRACEMYSASLVKEEFQKIKSMVKGLSHKMEKALDDCNKDMLTFKRECDDIEVYRDFTTVSNLYFHLLRLISAYEEFLNEYQEFEGREEVLILYFDIRHFVSMYEDIDEDYLVYTTYNSDNNFLLRLNCMNPARKLSYILKKGRSAIFFSATFLPITYYKEQLAGKEDDYAIYVNSPFDTSKRLLMIANDVSTKYSRRNEDEYNKIARYICNFAQAKVGNYMVFFPSYSFMENVYEYLQDEILKFTDMQKSNMTELEKEEYLNSFVANPKETHIGFCVMGGIFGEGIDLKNDRLIGVIVVGTGLPMVCNEREIYRGYYDDINNNGFDYAYLFNGMNKVLQAAGRVIRTYEDVGTILLLDDRFLLGNYKKLFPREWNDYKVVNVNNISNYLDVFWKERN